MATPLHLPWITVYPCHVSASIRNSGSSFRGTPTPWPRTRVVPAVVTRLDSTHVVDLVAGCVASLRPARRSRPRHAEPVAATILAVRHLRSDRVTESIRAELDRVSPGGPCAAAHRARWARDRPPAPGRRGGRTGRLRAGLPRTDRPRRGDRAELLDWIERSLRNETNAGPARIGRYQILAELDGGGQAQTFRAVHPLLQTTVVLSSPGRPIRIRLTASGAKGSCSHRCRRTDIW